jgi:hypothetical protein
LKRQLFINQIIGAFAFFSVSAICPHFWDQCKK